MKKKAVFNWSGGKDSAHALLRTLESCDYEIVSLLTTVNASTRLSTMHNIPLPLLELQSQSIGIPLKVVELTPKGNMEDYGSAMKRAVEEFHKLGVTHFIFGDIFLHDIRSYREQMLAPCGIEVVEPLWNKSSEQVIREFLETGLQTVVVTTMEDGLGLDAIGAVIDRDFISSLPATCDPNGENGEYHTFCYDGPIFSFPIPFSLGRPHRESFDIRMEDGSMKTFTYCFADLSVLE